MFYNIFFMQCFKIYFFRFNSKELKNYLFLIILINILDKN